MRKKSLNRKIKSTLHKWLEAFNYAFIDPLYETVIFDPLYETGYLILISLKIRVNSAVPLIEPTIINPPNYQFLDPFKVCYKLVKRMFYLSLRRLPKFP